MDSNVLSGLRESLEQFVGLPNNDDTRDKIRRVIESYLYSLEPHILPWKIAIYSAYPHWLDIDVDYSEENEDRYFKIAIALSITIEGKE